MINSIILFVLFLNPVFAKAEEARKVSVSGQCRVEVMPDRGSVNFVVEKLEKDSATAIKNATSLYERLRSELKKSNAKDLELISSEYQVQERKEWEKNKNVSKGFSARLGLKVITSEVGDLGKLMDIAGKLGITETNNLSTYVSESRWLSERKKCLTEAVKNAEEKAQALVIAAHSKLGKVDQITELSSSPSAPIAPQFADRGMMKSAMREESAPPTVSGEKQSLIQEVQVVFFIDY